MLLLPDANIKDSLTKSPLFRSELDKEDRTLHYDGIQSRNLGWPLVLVEAKE